MKIDFRKQVSGEDLEKYVKRTGPIKRSIEDRDYYSSISSYNFMEIEKDLVDQLEEELDAYDSVLLHRTAHANLWLSEP